MTTGTTTRSDFNSERDILRNARHLPAGRPQAGDRHLNFHDAWDNLAVRRTSSIRAVWGSTSMGEP